MNHCWGWWNKVPICQHRTLALLRVGWSFQWVLWRIQSEWVWVLFFWGSFSTLTSLLRLWDCWKSSSRIDGKYWPNGERYRRWVATAQLQSTLSIAMCGWGLRWLVGICEMGVSQRYLIGYCLSVGGIRGCSRVWCLLYCRWFGGWGTCRSFWRFG